FSRVSHRNPHTAEREPRSNLRNGTPQSQRLAENVGLRSNLVHALTSLASAKACGAPMMDLTLAETPAAVGLIPECAYPSTAEPFEGLIRDEYKSLARTIFALRRGPIRYGRGQTIVIEGEPSEYIVLVISGVIRSFRSFQNGTR